MSAQLTYQFDKQAQLETSQKALGAFEEMRTREGLSQDEIEFIEMNISSLKEDVSRKKQAVREWWA